LRLFKIYQATRFF